MLLRHAPRKLQCETILVDVRGMLMSAPAISAAQTREAESQSRSRALLRPSTTRPAR